MVNLASPVINGVCLWEEARAPGENPLRHWENMQTQKQDHPQQFFQFVQFVLSSLPLMEVEVNWYQ